MKSGPKKKKVLGKEDMREKDHREKRSCLKGHIVNQAHKKDYGTWTSCSIQKILVVHWQI